MAEIERGTLPYEAAQVTRRELVDYTRLTDFARIWMRGLLMLFHMVKKNAENWLPGLRRGADGTRAKGAAEAAGRHVDRNRTIATERNKSGDDEYRVKACPARSCGSLSLPRSARC